MGAAPFDYLSVESYDDAVEALQQGGDEARVIAGGQSLLAMMNLRLARPSMLVDLNPIGSEPPAADGGTLRLGALTRYRSLLEEPLVQLHCPLLAEAAWYVGNVRVRNRGTIAGSLAHADPTSELAAACIVLGTSVVAQGPQGTRTIALDDLLVSYLTTSLESAEVITDVLVPCRQQREGFGFKEMVRRTSDLAIVAAAARVRLEGGEGVVSEVALSLAGVSDRVLLVGGDLLAGLVGSPLDRARLFELTTDVAASTEPPSDVHASGEYRRRLVEVLSRRAIEAAFEQARSA
ncbi:MAG: FAD binding domain-containing protein [Acidimicrobiales bacterium]